MKNYQVLAHIETVEKVTAYIEQIKSGTVPGRYMFDRIKHLDLNQITTIEFIELLVRTKRPQIFAETEVYGNGIDWNQSELSILGDISIVTPVTVYDNGKHRNPDLHPIPFAATLIFTPGALLRNGNKITPVDWDEVTSGGEFDRQKEISINLNSVTQEIMPKTAMILMIMNYLVSSRGIMCHGLGMISIWVLDRQMMA